MRKYKIEITQKEKYIVDVYATSQDEATDIATEAFNDGNYQETGDLDIEISMIYDVTNTDDPFYPIIMPTQYILIDRQGTDIMKDIVFNSREEVLKALQNYHQDVENINNMTLDDILDIGDWELQEIIAQ